MKTITSKEHREISPHPIDNGKSVPTVNENLYNYSKYRYAKHVNQLKHPKWFLCKIMFI